MKPLSKITMKIAILLVASFISSICSAQSQYGEIRGKVTDAKTKSILDYATIVVKQDGIVKASTSSDEYGDYTIANLPAGEYTIEVSYVGYSKYQVNGVLVKAGNITLFNCELKVIENYTDCPIYIHTNCKKLINETDNIRTLYSKDILKLPMRD